MRNIELAEKIKLSIKDEGIPLWFPELTNDLTEAGWQRLKRDLRLTESTYGSARIMKRNINTPRFVFPSQKNEIPFSIELLPEELTEIYCDSQIGFYSPSELNELSVLGCLIEAIKVLKTVPSLNGSISTLVKSLHLIKVDDDAYDVSFSEPKLPFSIFISVPKKRIKFDFLRVAEAVVHEAMHLQLSFIERAVPLVQTNEQKFYSPWKDEYRNSTGVLHALYVFRTVDSFYEQVEFSQSRSTADLDFIKNRRNEILRQIMEISEFSRNSDLNNSGLDFTKRLLNKENSNHGNSNHETGIASLLF